MVERSDDLIRANFEGSEPEYERWLRTELRQFAEPGQAPPTKEARYWNDERVDFFVRRIKPDALKAVEYIARHAPEVTFDEVAQKALGGVTGPVLGGMMASVGFALKEMGAQNTPPYVRNGSRRSYQMDPEDAAVFLAAIERTPSALLSKLLDEKRTPKEPAMRKGERVR